MFKNVCCEDNFTCVRGFVLNLSNKYTMCVNDYPLTHIVHFLDKCSKILQNAWNIHQDTSGVF
jgi:hypothetical protein